MGDVIRPPFGNNDHGGQPTSSVTPNNTTPNIVTPLTPRIKASASLSAPQNNARATFHSWLVPGKITTGEAEPCLVSKREIPEADIETTASLMQHALDHKFTISPNKPVLSYEFDEVEQKAIFTLRIENKKGAALQTGQQLQMLKSLCNADAIETLREYVATDHGPSQGPIPG